MSPRSPWATSYAAAAPILLAGLLPMSPEIGDRWMIGGRWVYPVGHPLGYHLAAGEEETGYAVTRNVRRKGAARHQGADLSNQRGGGSVRAASAGLVVSAGDAGNGYGQHVVIAHRLPEGGVVVSVYAHLVPGSITVDPGQPVSLGQSLGRVGTTGNARSPHVHFEVRRLPEGGVRWELAEPVDPLAFVASRLPSRDGDTTWAAPYLSWAEAAGVLLPLDAGEELVRRGRWRQALAALDCQGREFLVGPAEPSTNPLPPTPSVSQPLDSLGHVTWAEVARDLMRVRETGICLPPPSGIENHPAHCRARFNETRPAGHLPSLARRKSLPMFADLALLLADLAER